MMKSRIIRGVRIVTPTGMQAASVHIREGNIVAVAGYDDIPRTAIPEELGKGVLMPGLVQPVSEESTGYDCRLAVAGGITTLLLDDEIVEMRLKSSAQLSEIDTTPKGEIATILPRTWTAMRNRGDAVEDIVETLCTAPARAAGLASDRGQIKIGMRADLVIWHPEYTVTGSSELLYGQLRQTILRGQTMYKDGVFAQDE